MFKNSITENVRVLQDVSKTGRERPWKEKKEQSRELAALYYALVDKKMVRNMVGNVVEAGDLEMVNKAERAASCGSWLEFYTCPEGHEKRLKGALFCQLRLCPMCAWRRSLKIFSQLSRVLHVAVEREPRLQFIFLNLTAESVTKEKLSGEMDRFFRAWKRLTERKAFKDAVVGWFRSLEVTRDNDRYVTEERYWKNPGYYKARGLKVGSLNPNYGRFHPHFHSILAVKPSYFTGKKYLSQKAWGEMWRKSLRIDYDPIVYVKRVREREGQSLEGAALEVGKYTVKPADYLLEDPDEAAEVVEILDRVLRNRRLVAYGGLFRKIRQELRMEDVESESADLINVDEDGVVEGCQCSICRSGMLREVYQWNVGLKNYVLVEEGE